MTVAVELRCPVGPRALLAKVLAAGQPVVTTDDNLVELTCRDCRRAETRNGRPCRLVLHRFDIAGELVETKVVR